jgi:hypothetical protein
MDAFYHVWFSEEPIAVIVWTLERELDKDTLYKEVTVKIVWLLAVVFGVICAKWKTNQEFNDIILFY